MDRDGNIIYHPQQQLLYAGLKSEDTEALAALRDGTYVDDTVIYCLTSVAGSDWRVVGVSYVDELVNRNVRDMIRLSAMLAVVVLAALCSPAGCSPVCWAAPAGLAFAMESFEADADHFTYRPVGGTGRCRSCPTPSATWCCAFSSSCPPCGRRRSTCAKQS